MTLSSTFSVTKNSTLAEPLYLPVSLYELREARQIYYREALCTID